MGILNTFLFLFFLANCFYNFKQLYFDHQNYPVHGVVLLSTVGTQSIIVLLNRVFFQFPVYFSEAVILLGLVFYLAGIILILKRYWRQKEWTLVNDWTNTNCIIHGALSITGLAIVSTNTFTARFVNYFWIVIFCLLCIVEVIELIRAVKRIKQYGWSKGIFQYNVSQWSRNFTFGMFFTFTLFMQRNPFYTIPGGLHIFQAGFLRFWAWIVLIALLAQIGLYIKSRMTFLYTAKN